MFWDVSPCSNTTSTAPEGEYDERAQLCDDVIESDSSGCESPPPLTSSCGVGPSPISILHHLFLFHLFSADLTSPVRFTWTTSIFVSTLSKIPGLNPCALVTFLHDTSPTHLPSIGYTPFPVVLLCVLQVIL